MTSRARKWIRYYRQWVYWRTHGAYGFTRPRSPKDAARLGQAAAKVWCFTQIGTTTMDGRSKLCMNKRPCEEHQR